MITEKELLIKLLVKNTESLIELREVILQLHYRVKELEVIKIGCKRQRSKPRMKKKKKNSKKKKKQANQLRK